MEKCKKLRSRGWLCCTATDVAYLLLAMLGICSVQTSTSSSCSSFAPPATLKGRKFFDSVSGKYIPLKGIAYYPRPNTGNISTTNSVDFYVEDLRAIWERDIAYFKKLNINLVRIYAIDPDLNHDGFMCALRAAGIYIIIDLGAHDITFDAAPNCYPVTLKKRGQYVISQLSRYDNVLAFSAGNEASLGPTTPAINGPCQKQFIRDMRAYIQGCNKTMRHIPIGLSFADALRKTNALWYGCRSVVNDELENAEYLGINEYLDCDSTATSVDQLVGYKQLLSDFTSYNLTVPVILTEFGCLNPGFPQIGIYQAQRTFLSVDALFSPQYRTQFVGGIAFEYSTELINALSPYPFTAFDPGNYGVGYFAPINCDDFSVPCNYTPFPQFEFLAAKYAAVTANDEPSLTDYSSFNQIPPACPAEFLPLNSFTWPGASLPDLSCPVVVQVTCPNIPAECNNLGNSALPPEPSTPTITPAPMSMHSTSAPSSAVPGSAPPVVVAGPTNSSLPNSKPSVSTPTSPILRSADKVTSSSSTSAVTAKMGSFFLLALTRFLS